MDDYSLGSTVSVGCKWVMGIMCLIMICGFQSSCRPYLPITDPRFSIWRPNISGWTREFNPSECYWYPMREAGSINQLSGYDVKDRYIRIFLQKFRYPIFYYFFDGFVILTIYRTGLMISSVILLHDKIPLRTGNREREKALPDAAGLLHVQ